MKQSLGNKIIISGLITRGRLSDPEGCYFVLTDETKSVLQLATAWNVPTKTNINLLARYTNANFKTILCYSQIHKESSSNRPNQWQLREKPLHNTAIFWQWISLLGGFSRTREVWKIIKLVELLRCFRFSDVRASRKPCPSVGSAQSLSIQTASNTSFKCSSPTSTTNLWCCS